MLKVKVVILVLMACALMACKAERGDVGRYEATSIGPNGYYFFILDTKEGHFWEYGMLGKEIVYKGQLEPGEKMGDVVAYINTYPGLTPQESKKLDELENLEKAMLRDKKRAELLKEKPEKEREGGPHGWNYFFPRDPQPGEELKILEMPPGQKQELERLRSRIKDK